MTEKRSGASAPLSASPSAPAKPELVITRVFDSPRDLVWKAWVEPERAVQGPKR